MEGLVDVVWSTDTVFGYHKGLYGGAASEGVILMVRECREGKRWIE